MPMQESSSSGCCRWPTTLACWRKNTIPGAKRLVGNFPQALSHIALVNAAFNLGDRLQRGTPSK